MKLVFKIIGLIVGIFIALVIFLAIMFYKDFKMPVEQYTQSEEYFQKRLDDELQLIMTDDTKENIEVTLTEVFINQFMMRELSKDNPKYQDEAFKDEPAYEYMYLSATSGMRAGIKGVSTDILEDRIDLVVSVHALAGSTRLYKTGVYLSLDVILDEDDEYVFKVRKINIGKLGLPVKTGLNIANYITSKINGKSINEMANEALPFGVFDSKTASFTATEQTVLDYATSQDVGYGALLEIIYTRNLINIAVEDENISIGFALGQLRKLPTDATSPTFNPITDTAGQVSFMNGLAAQFLAEILNPSANPYVDLNEIEANQIVDYSLKDSLQFEQEFKLKINETEEVIYHFNSSKLFLTMEDNILSLHLPFEITRDGITEKFDILFNIDSTVSVEAEDLVLTITGMRIGTAVLTETEIQMIEDTYGSGMIQEGKVRITKEQLSEAFAGQNIEFNDAEVVNGMLRLYYNFN